MASDTGVISRERGPCRVDQVAVLVATRDRPDLLDTRALPSVVAQTASPSFVLVVDDSPGTCAPATAEVVARWGKRLPGLRLLQTGGGRGAAAAWNVGIRRIAAEGRTWVAIHDDDDRWEPSHLERCVAVAANTRVDAVVSGIVLEKDGVRHEWKPPAPFGWRDFLGGNPGWQGSNTFVRVDRLIEVGGFDEGLVCTHDRDLAIRLLRLDGFCVLHTGLPTVTYHLDSDRDALSTRGSPRKRAGLQAFFAKHGNLMDDSERTQFLERAERLFGFPPETFLSP